MINFTDLQDAFLIALAIPIQWLAVFALLMTVLLALNLMAWVAMRRIQNL